MPSVANSLLHPFEQAREPVPTVLVFRLCCVLVPFVPSVAHRLSPFIFDRNRFASVRILSISIFIRTMPSQCV